MTEKMYAIKNMKEKDYLAYAEKKKKLFGKGTKHYTVSSPFPTVRPKSHIKYFKKWIINTPNPEDFKIVEFKEQGTFSTLEETEGNNG